MLYRTDIDGLRAIAVISVVLFHLGFLPNGYLGVDIFFVISGYLITSIVYDKSEKNEFSVLEFYQRRIRRIIPLLLFTSVVALVVGVFLMLPDDLDNLAQSVFASNFSANNILMYITSSDYWAVKNEYKPLMHTWSLGVEEQFYLIYPFIFLSLPGARSRHVLPVLGILTLLSFSLFLFWGNPAEKFYLLHYRFFEFIAGGLAAVYFKKATFNQYSYSGYLLALSIVMVLITLATPTFLSHSIEVTAITLFTTTILVAGNFFFGRNTWYDRLLTNRPLVTIGKISFSIYMVHQVVFAFARYAYLEEITALWALVLVAITLSISFFTYHYIENPFRNPQLFSIKKVLALLIPVFLISSAASLYIYSVGGIIRDYPALNIYRDKSTIQRKLFRVTTNIHIHYNEDVRQLDKDFEPSDQLKILVIGNSFGRDITNILLESEELRSTQIRYFDISRINTDNAFPERAKEADRIVFAGYRLINYGFTDGIEADHQLSLDRGKIWVFGTKSYGTHNGIHYNSLRPSTNFSTYRTKIETSIYELNQEMKDIWGDRFIDLMAPIADENGEVLVFTPTGKFLSSDTAHLTEEGARYYAALLKIHLEKIVAR